MNIVVSINKKFAQHFHVMLFSLIYNSSKKDIKVHILNHDLDTNDELKIRESFNNFNFIDFEFYKIDPNEFKGLDLGNSHFSVECFYRIYIAKLLPEEIEKVLYLDSDLLVLTDIYELYKENIDDYYLAACNEYVPFLSKNIGLKSELDYFNSGVLLINLKRWRENNFHEICLRFAYECDKTLYCVDQDILNGVLDGNWKRLNLSWNVVRNLFEEADINKKVFGEQLIEDVLEKPKILHFTTYSKPWYYFDDHPLKNLYEKYLNLSNWTQSSIRETDILNQAQVYIFGSGNGGQKVYEFICDKVKVEGFIDNNPNKKNEVIKGIRVISPFKYNKNELVIIGSGGDFVDEIASQLELLGFKKGITYFKSINEFYLDLYNNRNEIWTTIND